MVMDSGKVTDVIEVMVMEEGKTVEEGMMDIRIAPKTPGTVLTSERFLGISAVTSGMLFMETVNHMSAVNTAIQRLLADAVKMAHAGGAVVIEDGRSQKLLLIGLNQDVENVVAEDEVYIMSLALWEERIDS